MGSFLGAELGRTRKARDAKSYARGWEKRKEADERVEVNLDPWEIATWRQNRTRFKGTPDERLRAFRDWSEEHEAETRGERARETETMAARLIREKRAREKGVKVPCAAPWRYRTRAACRPGNGNGRWKRPSWTLFGGRRVEVPCEEPYRFRVKRDCAPKKRKAATWADLAKTRREEEPGAFDDLLYG